MLERIIKEGELETYASLVGEQALSATPQLSWGLKCTCSARKQGCAREKCVELMDRIKPLALTLGKWDKLIVICNAIPQWTEPLLATWLNVWVLSMNGSWQHVIIGRHWGHNTLGALLFSPWHVSMMLLDKSCILFTSIKDTIWYQPIVGTTCRLWGSIQIILKYINLSSTQ